MKPKERCIVPGCGQIKNGSNHVGETWDHDYEAPPREGFGSRRTPIASRSPKMREVYEKPGGRRDRVKAAVADGRRRCQVKIPDVCTGYVETLHETASRGRFGGLEAAVRAGGETPACNACNFWCSEHPREAQELGFMHSNTVTGRREASKHAERPREQPESDPPTPRRRSRLTE